MCACGVVTLIRAHFRPSLTEHYGVALVEALALLYAKF